MEGVKAVIKRKHLDVKAMTDEERMEYIDRKEN